MFRNSLTPLLMTSVAFSSACKQLEQADPSRIVRMFVRVYAPSGHPGTDFDICNDIGAEFTLRATPGADNDADVIETSTNSNVPFEATTSFDDTLDDPTPIETAPPGCFVGRNNLVLTTGNWTLSAERQLTGGVQVWSASCDVLISADENTTNSPWVGFSANGEEYPPVNTTEGCVFEDIELVTNVFP